jgi:tetraacyldisaccharide 4'-kinase
MIYQKTGAPVAVAPKRCSAVRALLAEEKNLQIIITDDGLQHYALFRDKEIGVIDGLYRFGNSWLLPAGPMRERRKRLSSLDAIIVAGDRANLDEISMSLHPGLAVNLATGEQRRVNDLSNVVAIAGISHPKRFFNTLSKCHLFPIKTVSLSDHYVLSEKAITSFCKPGQNLLMTEKDAVKYCSFARSYWWYLPIEAKLKGIMAENLLSEVINLVFS